MLLLAIPFEHSVRHETDFWRFALYCLDGVFVTVLPGQVRKALKTTKTR